MSDNYSLLSRLNTWFFTLFPRIIAGCDYFFFRTKRGRLFDALWERRLFHIYIIHCWKSCSKFSSFFPSNHKIIASKKPNMGFLSVPNLVSWLIFIVNILCIITDQLDQAPLQPHPPDFPLWVSIAGYLQWWEVAGGGGAIISGRWLF